MHPLLALCLLLPAQPFIDRTADLGGETPLDLAGTSAAWGDVNGDAYPDLYVRGRLYLNNAGRSFSRVDVPGAGEGLLADLDNDGLGDLVCFSPIALFRNLGPGANGSHAFAPVVLPTIPPTVCLGAAVADFNNDAFLDLYTGGYEDWEKQTTFPSFLLLSDRGTAFSLAMTAADNRARGVTACDFDQDGDSDIYVSNYRLQPNTLWINDGRGGLSNQAADRNVLATSPGFRGGHSIGACWGDFDADGRIDLFAGNFAHVDSRGDQPKSRFLRSGGSDAGWKFDDLGPCGIRYQESYASPACADFDNDSRLDLFFTTVYAIASFKTPNHPVLMRNATRLGATEWEFTDVTADAGLANLPPTYQAAWADFDNDGDLDLVAAGRLLVNMRITPGQPVPPDANWLALRLIGGTSNRDAIGTQVRLTLSDGRILTRQVECGSGQGNANSPVLHFGLGAVTGPLDATISWPGSPSHAQPVSKLETNRLHTIHQPGPTE